MRHWNRTDTRALLVAIATIALLALAGCGSEKPPARRVEPPAAAEVQDLRRDQLAHERQAAEASAAGDQAKADYHRRLADELAGIRARWEKIEAGQREQLDAAARAAQREADARAEAQQRAADVRRARIIAGIGLALCAAAGALGAWFGLGRLALPIAGAAAIGCLTLAAFAESARAWWFLPAILGGLAVLVVAAVRIARGDRALLDTAAMADAIEGKGHAAAAKARAWASQRAAGLLHRVARHRGKAPKPAPPT